MTEPVWLRVARRDIGLRELPGAPTAPRIASWLAMLGAWWRDDETPWCGTAVAAWLQRVGLKIPKDWYRALAWADWGVPIDRPEPGAIAVFRRQGGGHVGLVVGQDQRGRLLILGGNQGNAVNVSPFERDRLVGFYWPTEAVDALRFDGLPVYASAQASSVNEA